jgi:hypothetical protein
LCIGGEVLFGFFYFQKFHFGFKFGYQDNRNYTSHDYGVELANETLVLIAQFIIDAQNLLKVIEKNDT